MKEFNINEEILSLNDLERLNKNEHITFVTTGTLFKAIDIAKQKMALEIMKLLLEETNLDKVFPEIMSLKIRGEIK